MANSLGSINSVKELIKTTTLMKESCSFVWKIEHFRKFMDRKYEFPSPIYSTDSVRETAWKMVVFPESIYPAGVNVALRLQKVSDDDMICSLIYKISIVDSKGKYFLKQTREKVFRRYLDFDDCLVISNMALKEENLLQKESLIISCEIDFVAVNNELEDSSSLDPPNYDSIPKYNLAESKFDKQQIESVQKCLKGCTVDADSSISGLNEPLMAFSRSSLSDSKQKTQKSIDLLSSDFKSFYMSKYQTDITIRVDDGELQAHRAILAARSEYFKQAISQCIENSDINIPELTKVTLDNVLYYLYTGQLQPLTYQMAIDLLASSKKFNLVKLQDEIQNFLKFRITVDNVTDLLQISKEMQMDTLKNNALKFISANHFEVTKTEKWNKMIRNDPHAAGEVLLTVASFQKTPNYRF